jgi:hypothetical protein
MSFDGKNPFKIMRQTWNVGGFEAITLGASKTLTHADAQNLFLNGGGSNRTITLPAPRKGAWFKLYNSGSTAHNLLVAQADDSTTLVTVNQDEMAIVFCPADAADDSASGWSLGCVVNIEQS